MRHRRHAAVHFGWVTVLACSEPQSRPTADSRVADRAIPVSESRVAERAVPASEPSVDECAVPSDSSVWELPVLPGTQVLRGKWPPVGLDSAYAYFMRNLAATENDGRPPATLTVAELAHDGPDVVACQPGDGTRPTRTWRLLVKKVFSGIPTVVGVTRPSVDSVEVSALMDSLERTKPTESVSSGPLDPQDTYGRSLVRAAERSGRRIRAILIVNLRDPNPRVRASALDILRRLGQQHGWAGNRGTHAEAVFKELPVGYDDTSRTGILAPLVREIASADTAWTAAVLTVFDVLCPADVWLAALERTPTSSRDPASLRPAVELLRRRVAAGDPQCSRTPPVGQQ